MPRLTQRQRPGVDFSNVFFLNAPSARETAEPSTPSISQPERWPAHQARPVGAADGVIFFGCASGADTHPRVGHPVAQPQPGAFPGPSVAYPQPGRTNPAVGAVRGHSDTSGPHPLNVTTAQPATRESPPKLALAQPEPEARVLRDTRASGVFPTGIADLIVGYCLGAVITVSSCALAVPGFDLALFTAAAGGLGMLLTITGIVAAAGWYARRP